MFVLNGVTALIGILITWLFMELHFVLPMVTGGWLILMAFPFLWAFFFISDVAEEWLIERFNQQ